MSHTMCHRLNITIRRLASKENVVVPKNGWSRHHDPRAPSPARLDRLGLLTYKAMKNDSAILYCRHFFVWNWSEYSTTANTENIFGDCANPPIRSRHCLMCIKIGVLLYIFIIRYCIANVQIAVPQNTLSNSTHHQNPQFMDTH